MSDFDNGGWNNPFPHDGEGHGNCTGLGCDCDERNYGYHSSRNHKGSSSGGGGIFIGFIVALIIGYGFNELIGAIIMIGLIIYIAAK